MERQALRGKKYILIYSLSLFGFWGRWGSAGFLGIFFQRLLKIWHICHCQMSYLFLIFRPYTHSCSSSACFFQTVMLFISPIWGVLGADYFLTAMFFILPFKSLTLFDLSHYIFLFLSPKFFRPFAFPKSCASFFYCKILLLLVFFFITYGNFCWKQTVNRILKQ